MRAHGFELSLHPFQVASWVVFGVDVLIFAIIAIPQVSTLGAQIAVAVLYVASVATLVAATVRATACNPVDPRVVSAELQQPSDDDFDCSWHCNMCDCYVNPRSKHCRICNKCVDVFDHHCMWLNNCIGKKNYSAFVVTITSVAVMLAIVLGSVVYLITDYFVNPEAFQQRLRLHPITNLPKEAMLGLILALIAINGPLFMLDLQLVLLHVFLWSQNLTTFDYIMHKRSQQDERQSGGQSEEGGIRRRMKTLPRCMDWIVFCRCGQRRKKPNKMSIQPIGKGTSTPAPGDAQADGSDSGMGSREGSRGQPEDDVGEPGGEAVEARPGHMPLPPPLPPSLVAGPHHPNHDISPPVAEMRVKAENADQLSRETRPSEPSSLKPSKL